MQIDIGDLSPLQPDKYLSMLFVSGGFVMICFYFKELAERKEWLAFIVFGAGAFALWRYGLDQGWRAPGF